MLKMLLLTSLLCAIASLARASTLQNVLQEPHAHAYSLNFAASAPHIFSSLRSLLQQWPNTFFPNGHSIVPCEIPPFTNLYHGRRDGDLPPSPEWFAFDAEMSYGIMGSTRNSFMLTYQTVHPVKCLYFDGMSAALMGRGQLDSQMAFLYGNTSGPPDEGGWRGLQDEYNRAAGLCDWAERNGVGGIGGVEGIVRMNAGFELIWCNFSSPSIRLISQLNVTAPLLPEAFWEDVGAADDHSAFAELGGLESRYTQKTKTLPALPSPTRNNGHSTPDPNPAVPPNWRSQRELEPFLRSQTVGWYRSATWHLGSTSSHGSSSGENRVRLLTCGFATYYDQIFQNLSSHRKEIEANTLNLTSEGKWKGQGVDGNRSLALKQLIRRRRSHTLERIDAAEAPLMNAAVLSALHDLSENSCSGVDWIAVASDISSRYSSPLSEFAQLLSFHPSGVRNDTAVKLLLASARARAHSMLMPFFHYPTTAFQNASEYTSSSPWRLGSELGRTTLGRCQYAYTRLLYGQDGSLHAHIQPRERLLIDAVEEVLNSICATAISTGFEIEHIWLSYFNNAGRSLASALPDLDATILSWQLDLEELISWLGWASDSVTCDRLCRVDEVCYIPMWPLRGLEGREGGRFRGRPPPAPKKGGPGKPPPKNDHQGRPILSGRPPRDLFEEELWSPQCVKWDL